MVGGRMGRPKGSVNKTNVKATNVQEKSENVVAVDSKLKSKDGLKSFFWRQVADDENFHVNDVAIYTENLDVMKILSKQKKEPSAFYSRKNMFAVHYRCEEGDSTYNTLFQLLGLTSADEKKEEKTPRKTRRSAEQVELDNQLKIQQKLQKKLDKEKPKVKKQAKASKVARSSRSTNITKRRVKNG